MLPIELEGLSDKSKLLPSQSPSLGSPGQGLHLPSLRPSLPPSLLAADLLGTTPRALFPFSLCLSSSATPNRVSGLCPELPGAGRMLSHTTTLPEAVTPHCQYQQHHQHHTARSTSTTSSTSSTSTALPAPPAAAAVCQLLVQLPRSPCLLHQRSFVAPETQLQASPELTEPRALRVPPPWNPRLEEARQPQPSLVLRCCWATTALSIFCSWCSAYFQSVAAVLLHLHIQPILSFAPQPVKAKDRIHREGSVDFRGP